jgi:hypothetical protein
MVWNAERDLIAGHRDVRGVRAVGGLKRSHG